MVLVANVPCTGLEAAGLDSNFCPFVNLQCADEPPVIIDGVLTVYLECDVDGEECSEVVSKTITLLCESGSTTQSVGPNSPWVSSTVCCESDVVIGPDPCIPAVGLPAEYPEDNQPCVPGVGLPAEYPEDGDPCVPAVDLPPEYPEDLDGLCEIVDEPSSVQGGVGDPVDFGGVCDECPGVYQKLVNGVWVETSPPATISPADYNSQWVFVCGSDTSKILTISGSEGLLTDRTAEPDEPVVVCHPCDNQNQLWQIRIDDAEADNDNPANPVGDRPNSDPGLPEPVDEAWQDLPEVMGHACVTFEAIETWIDGLDPDVQGEFLCLYVRSSCDNRVSWTTEAKIRWNI